MRSLRPLLLAGAVSVAPALVSSATAADAAAKSTSPRPAPSASKAGRVLPDPALLDGSALPAIKKNEHGMIGDFELPGDDNARSGKVGGQQAGQPPPQGGGGQQSNMPMGLPSGGGASGGQPPQGGAQSGGQPQAGGQQQGGAQSQAGGQQGGAGNPIPSGGDPGAQAQGTQVAELGGEGGQQAGGQQGGAAGPADGKPQQVSIGDKAMRIENGAAAQAGVVGAQQQQQAGATQHHEKGTGSGGKGAGGAGGPNRVEKGRAIPAGL